MSNYSPAITKNSEGSFYALIVRTDYDNEKQVIHGYTGRHFKTEKAALKSTNTYIAKHCQ